MSAATLYDRCAREAASVVIGAYSTSFALACRLLGKRTRQDVRCVYALVRIADEVVDGTADAAGVAPDEQRAILDALEAETLHAVAGGFSTNLVVHAFALTARACGIGADLIVPFFASMRTDLDTSLHDGASHDAYVYGSAEVIGLMCLQIFVNAGSRRPIAPDPALVDGARRLGAAFQDINFLRDRSDDAERLGRDYLGLSTGENTREDVLQRIQADLDAAAAVIPRLPRDCRRAVTVAHGLFAELAQRLRSADPDTRVSVPGGVKARIAARSLLRLSPRSTS
ncbi:phytoene/squalene synthase family protein [Microbacterium sp. TNHR37B]|uniref:phytoene/squalene synthase family protein n=1 Tax=Microbacterium sp. TNHR37B TaxID=1775956 RepID=UPI0007B30E7C|nr:squalene/phytoene synthase family protein [Microbacterium sp. TNHR37B]KZE91245.1 All-trans-phytoene synthase/15-cis-phytoene synthase [Microbacterium sp. TNHR37B]